MSERGEKGLRRKGAKCLLCALINRQSNPDVKIWMSKRNATNYAVLENYYEDR